MGRKKKLKKENREKSTTAITYHGSVKVSVRYGDKVLKSKSYNNEGLKPLFIFLSNCLLGNYSESESQRPKYVRVFTIGEAGDNVPANASNFSELLTNADTEELTTNSSIYSGEPLYDSSTPSVKFKFVVPFTQISSTNYRNINMFALYSQNYSGISDVANASAYVILRDEDNANLLSEAVKTDISSSKANEYNLFIEWTMSFN